MRILLLSHGYPPTVSGVTKVVQKLARALVSQGHQVAVVAASETRRPYRTEDHGIHVFRVRGLMNPVWSEGPLPIPSRRYIQEVITEFKPDIVHSHENFSLGTQLLRVRDGLTFPVIASSHALPSFGLHYIPGWKGLKKWVEQLIWRYVIWHLNQYEAVVFPTQAHRSEYLDRGLSVNSVVISNGVDLRRFHPPGGQIENVEECYQSPSGPRILFVGRICRDKHIDILIRAMPQIWAHSQAHLLLVGRGDARNELEALVHELNLDHCVHLLGYVPEPDLPALYRAVDLFAIAATCEVQSIPTLQALATGLPVIAANSGALPELIRDGVNGYLVPVDNVPAVSRAAQRILEDPVRARQFGQVGIQVGMEHAEDSTFRSFISLYQKIVSSWRTHVYQVRPSPLIPGSNGRQEEPSASRGRSRGKQS